MAPWDTERLNPAEMEALALGEQHRFNRQARALAWLAMQIRVAMYGAVTYGLAAAFSKDPPEPPYVTILDLLKSIPGYREVEE